MTTEETATKSGKRHRKPPRKTRSIEDIRVAKGVNRYTHDMPGINEGRNLIKIIYKTFYFFKKLKIIFFNFKYI